MNHSDNQSAMVTVSFITALISIATFQIFFISLPCAAISIILALISRGNGHLLPRAKAALCCATVAAILTTVVTSVSVYTVMHNPELREQIEQLYNYYTDPSSASDSSDGNSASGQDLIREILSGEYRENKQNSSDTGSSSSASGSGNSVRTDQIPGSDVFSAAQNGGSVI